MTTSSCRITCLPDPPSTLAQLEAKYTTALPGQPCPTWAGYAERREACGRVEYYEFAGPPSGSYFDAKTGNLLGIDYSAEGSCDHAGEIGFGCKEPIKCVSLCGTPGPFTAARCAPLPPDAGTDGAVLDGATD